MYGNIIPESTSPGRSGKGVAVITSLALFTQLASACAPRVAPGTLAAIAATESRFDSLAIYDNATHSAWWPKRPARAVALAHRLIGAGDSVDLGLMQINSANLAALHLTVQDAFDPCANLHAGAALLVNDYDGGRTQAEDQTALRTALSRYNSGTQGGGFTNGYVARVVGAARQVVPEIDPDAPRAMKPTADATPHDWNVFPDSLGPGRLARPVLHQAPSAFQREALGGANVPAALLAPDWNVFPQLAGPGRLASESAVTLTGHRASPVETAREDPQ